MTFKLYPKIFQLGHPENKDIFADPEDTIVVQEKMDGANFRFMVRDNKIVFGSRTQELNPDREHKYQKAFNRAIAYVLEQTSNRKLINDFIYYGECMTKHTIDYQWDTIPAFLGFDIYCDKLDMFLPATDAGIMFEAIGLPTVPVIGIVKAKDIIPPNDEIIPLSKYCPHKAEGLVYKNYTKKIFAKYVREEFKEQNAEEFGGIPKYAETEEAHFCMKYATNARIDKKIFSLLDSGATLDLPLMAQLPNLVWDDIWDEEYKNIIRDYQTLTFREARRLITKRCLTVLKSVMTNNAITRAPQETGVAS